MCYVTWIILYIHTAPHEESLYVFLSSHTDAFLKGFTTLIIFTYLTFLGLELGPTSGLKCLVLVEVHTHLSKILCFPYQFQFIISVRRNINVIFIQSFIPPSVLLYGQSARLKSSGDLPNGHTSLSLSGPETSGVPRTWPCSYPPSSCIYSKTEFSYSC